jgi:hypothetical protein
MADRADTTRLAILTDACEPVLDRLRTTRDRD